MSTRVTILLLLAAGFSALFAAGAIAVSQDPLSFRGEDAVARVEAVDRAAEPTEVTFRYETPDGQEVTAVTSRLVFVPPVGVPLPIEYDPQDPEMVQMKDYSESNLISGALVVVFTVCVGLSVLVWRRARARRRGADAAER